MEFVSPKHSNQITVLVPGAGYLRDGLGREIHKTPLFEIYQGKFVIERIIESIKNAGLSIISFATSNENKELLPLAEMIFERYPELEIDISFVKGGHDSLYNTLTQLISGRNIQENEPIALYLGDTVIDLPKQDSTIWEKNFYCVVDLEHPDARYQSASISQTRIAAGFYFWTSYQEFRKALMSATRANINMILDLFEPSNVQQFITPNWIDFGNSAYKVNFRANLTPSRFFNNVFVDERKGIVVKESSNTHKLKNEIHFVSQLPESLKYLFPRVLKVIESKTIDKLIVEMDFFPSRSLADIWFRKIEYPEVWEDIFNRIFEILNCEFSQFTCERRVNFSDFIRDNLKTRVSQFINQLQLEKLFRGEGTINGMRIREFWSLIDEVLNQVSVLDQTPLQIMHGDFCFSNILIQEETLLMRLVDPRGSFGNVGVYGSKLYDIGKLCHSVLGGYDHIVRDLFSLKIDDFEYNLAIPFLNFQREIQSIFLRKLQEMNISSEYGNMLSGLILTAIPIFHLDREERAKAMFVRGLYQMELSIQMNSSSSILTK